MQWWPMRQDTSCNAQCLLTSWSCRDSGMSNIHILTGCSKAFWRVNTGFTSILRLSCRWGPPNSLPWLFSCDPGSAHQFFPVDLHPTTNPPLLSVAVTGDTTVLQPSWRCHFQFLFSLQDVQCCDSLTPPYERATTSREASSLQAHLYAADTQNSPSACSSHGFMKP